MTDPIDERICAAAAAHEALVPAGYFDGVEAQVLARLAVGRDEFADDLPEDLMMSDTENNTARGPSRSPGAQPAPSADAEDSGLHDLRALAQTTKQRISRRVTAQQIAVDDSLVTSSSGLRAVALPEPARLVTLPDASQVIGSLHRANDLGAGAIAPISQARRRTGLYVGIGGGILAAAAAAVMVIGGGKPPARREASDLGPPRVPPAEVAAAPIAAGQPTTANPVAVSDDSVKLSSAVSASDPAVGGREADVPRGRKPDAIEAKPSSGGSSEVRTTDNKKPQADRPAAVSETKPTDAKVAAKPERAKPKAVDSGGEKSLDSLLDEATGGPSKPSTNEVADEAPKGPTKTSLDSSDIKAGMGVLARRAQGCYDQHGVAGYVKVKAIVSPSGKVTKVEAVGPFAGTPTGDCVADIARTASFPAWTGGPMTVPYGFTLQE